MTQSERRAESERALLTAAAELIAEEGIAGATFEKIGERAGYSRGLVSQHFGSKDGLIAALVEDLTARFGAVLAAEELDTLPPHEALAGFVDVYLRYIAAGPSLKAYNVLMSQSVAGVPGLRPVFAARHEAVRVQLRELIEAAQAAGTIPDFIDADATALSIGALLLGITTQLMIDPGLDVERIRRNAVDTLRWTLRLPR